MGYLLLTIIMESSTKLPGRVVSRLEVWPRPTAKERGFASRQPIAPCRRRKGASDLRGLRPASRLSSLESQVRAVIARGPSGVELRPRLRA